MRSRLQACAQRSPCRYKEASTDGGEVSDQNKEAAANKTPEYDAPKIEEVVTPGDLEREAQYAGIPNSQKKAN